MRRTSATLLAALLVVLATACDLRLVAPAGDGPVRYRDEVFGTVSVTSNIAYGSAVNSTGSTQQLLLDLYQPAGDARRDRPAIVWVHGGGFSSGTKTSPELVDQANVFAKKGYVNVSISYRLTPGGCSAAAPTASCVTAIFNAKHDAQAAVRFLRANASTYGIDANRIAIAGTSAGAITALNVGYDSTDVGDSGNPGYPSNVRAAVSLSGARILGAVDAADPPALLFHGTADLVVPYAWAQSTVAQANDGGRLAYLTSWEGAGHVPYLSNRVQILTETANFLYWTLALFQLPQ
jgi:predicted esterase